ncbi:MAG: hypothetical protein DRJ42_29790 [Deltaproteobacteria bacterium]|nr:MAG: hypothetical protein DRJ42_29790 [Deltaproteobacteria bacterium]
MEVEPDKIKKHITGLEVMERQHKQLHRRLRGLAEVLAAAEGGNGDPDALEGMPDQIDVLVDNIRVHFRAEEDVMSFHGYPQAETHRAAHGHFLEAVDKLLAQCGDCDLGGLRDVVDFLGGWLSTHVGKQDQMFKEFQESQAS